MKEKKQLEVVDDTGHCVHYDYDKLTKEDLLDIIANKKDTERVELWVYDYDETKEEHVEGELLYVIK